MNPIFIVDDELTIRETLSEILKDEGYSTVLCGNSGELFEKIAQHEPSLILLDVWLPGTDGMEVLKVIKLGYPNIPVIMMSGHAGIESAVKSIKYGAYDFLEKPLHLQAVLDKVVGALTHKPRQKDDLESPSDTRHETLICLNHSTGGIAFLENSDQPQRTIRRDVVLNGMGLLSGKNTGIILSPLATDKGVIFQTLDGSTVKGDISALNGLNIGDPTQQNFTANSTVLTTGSRQVRTVEHIMAVFHMFGITNVLIKAEEEIPNIDGSALDFCKLIEDAGIVEQNSPMRVVKLKERIVIGKESEFEKHLVAEPLDGFEVNMRVKYQAPILEQSCRFHSGEHSFASEIAPARSFNTLENIDMAQKTGKVGSGYLNSHIIMHEGKVINTELRFPDEFVRHKVLDLIGDLYLIGYGVRGKFSANMTSHGYNQALAQKIYLSLLKDGYLEKESKV